MLVPKNKLLLLYCALNICAQTAHAQSEAVITNESFSRAHNAIKPHNAASCNACHAVPVVGGTSRVSIKRTGSRSSGKFIEDQNSGSLALLTSKRFNNKEKDAEGLRITLNLLGDGYIEAVPGNTFEKLAREQVKATGGAIHGQVSRVSIIGDSNRRKTIGRFGWKSQHASLLSASAHALENELQVPNYLFPATVDAAIVYSPNSSSASGAKEELASIVRFLRSTEPIVPDAERSSSDSAQDGSRIFDAIGCSICHVRTLKTAPEASSLIGGAVQVTKRFANREIHPLSDYLLHDVGTGDGIVQNVRPQDYDDTTREKFRTAPLWGLRYRTWLMHDGKSVTYHQAIIRHSGEADRVTQRYLHLSPVDRENLRLFLDSL